MPHILANLEMKRFCRSQKKMNGGGSRNKLHRQIKNKVRHLNLGM